MPIQFGDGLSSTMNVTKLDYRSDGSIVFAAIENETIQLVGLYDNNPHQLRWVMITYQKEITHMQFDSQTYFLAVFSADDGKLLFIRADDSYIWRGYTIASTTDSSI